MVAMLVAMSVMAVMMTLAMPVWKQISQREKEEELVFRGRQYAHAISLFQRKFANAYPPNLDVLVEQRFLRKKFKDPITNDDFQPIPAGQGAPGTTQSPPAGSSATSGAVGRGSTARPGAVGRGSAATPNPAAPSAAGRGLSPIGTPGAGGVAGIMGVVSKSKEKSIRLYNGRGHYNEWAFAFQPPQQVPGGGAPGTATPGQRPTSSLPGLRQQQNQRGGGPGVPPEGGAPTGPGGRGFGPGVNPRQPATPIMPPARGRSGG